MVFCSDSRTNAGVDQISTYSKMFRYELGPDRQFVIMTAGNLATTQASMAQLKKDIRQKSLVNLNNVMTIGDAADYLGDVSVTQQDKHGGSSRSAFHATFILGGQIAGSEHRIVMIYPEGNHITSSKDTPYLQIGELKYGKPILESGLEYGTPLAEAVKLGLISFSTTMRANVAVGAPFDMLTMKRGFLSGDVRRIEEDDAYFNDLHDQWTRAQAAARRAMPQPPWMMGGPRLAASR